MIDKHALLDNIATMVEKLEALESWVYQVQRELLEVRLLVEQARAVQAAQASIEALTMPLTPATSTQGFLAARYQRRDGTVYGPPAIQADAGINSAVRGGDEAGPQPTRRDI